MPDNPATDAQGKRKAKSAHQPTSAYLFLVSSLAVFLTALVLGLGFRPLDPVRAVVAPGQNGEQIDSPDGAENRTAQLRKMATEIKSSETIQQALELMDRDENSAAARLTADRFQRNLKVSVRSSNVDGRSELVLDYQGTTSGAPELVNQLAQMAVRQYEKRFEQPARKLHYQAQQEATSAERKAIAARRRYEELISRVQPDFSATNDAVNGNIARGSLNSATTPAATSAIAAMIENPAWRDLTEQEQRLASKRLRFLETMTIEHPAVQQLDVDLAQIDQQRSKIPQLIENPAFVATAAPAPTSLTELAPSAASQEAGLSQAQLALEIKKSRAESTAADALVSDRQTELQASTEKLNAIESGQLEVIRWAETPSIIRGSDAITLIVAGLLAWLIGSVVAARGVPADPTITDSDEATELFGAPILGVLPAEVESPLAYAAELPRSTFLAAKACELTLAAMLFMALTLLVADDSFRAQLFSHPLASIPLGIERMREMMLS